MPLRSLLWRDPSVLKGPHEQLGLGRLAGLKERKQVGTAIPDMHHSALGGKAPQPRHQAHPDVRFSLWTVSSLAARLSPWSRYAHPGFLQRTAHHRATLRQDGQDRVQIQPSSALIADLAQARGVGMMAQVHFRGVLDQHHHRLFGDLFPRVLPMRLHERLKGHISFIQQSVQGHRLFPRLPLGWQGRRSMLGHACGHFHRTRWSTNSACADWGQRFVWPSSPGPGFLWYSSLYCSHVLIVYKRQPARQGTPRSPLLKSEADRQIPQRKNARQGLASVCKRGEVSR